MPDLKKVMKGLACCIKADGKHYPFCERCPYKDAALGTCKTVRALMADALSEIRAQKERIKELEELLYQGGCDGLNACSVKSCPYYNASHVRMEETKAAIILELQAENEKLKAQINDLQTAQAPRVMTLEEVAAAEVGFVEHKDSDELYAVLIIDVYADDTVGIKTADEDLEYWLSSLDYNKKWRCWTTEPTKEQREAILWES